jgi:sugar phosphate isomerase/epimerase
MKLTRRAFGTLALSGIAATALPMSNAFAHMVYSGVRIGSVTNSLRGTYSTPQTSSPEETVATLIPQLQALGLGLVEISVGTFRPVYKDGATPEERRAVLRDFRLSGKLQDQQIAIRKQFDDADIEVFSMSNAFSVDVTDEEIDAMFKAMEASNIRVFHSGSTKMETVPRLVPFVQKYGITFAGHPHGNPDPKEIGSWESMERVMEFGEGFDLCLDIGHFTAANGNEKGKDALAFLEKYHDRITHLHVKDRMVEEGPNVPLGAGDTPIIETMQMVRDNGWNIPAFLEREYSARRLSAFDDVRQQLDYIRNAVQG